MTLRIALTKGRTEQQVTPLLKQAGIDTSGLEDKQRRLIFEEDPKIHFILVKGVDVLTYLNRGSVDIGIVGNDILIEQQNHNYDMLDLRTGICRFALASTADFDPNQKTRKIIASKYPLITQQYFDKIGEDVEIVKIEGSVELAPLTGMADAIVDIVESGNTLRENHLKIFADNILPVSTRLVVNPLALKRKADEIFSLIDRLNIAIKTNATINA